MDYLPLISIPVLYFVVAFTKPTLQKKLPFNMCAICIAVSITWLLLLVLWLTGQMVSLISIAILMGMSVTGIMYKLEPIYKEKKIHNFWLVRLILMISGYLSIYLLLEEKWDVLVLVVIASMLIMALATFLFQGTTHSDVLHEQEKAGRKSSIIKKLDNCC